MHHTTFTSTSPSPHPIELLLVRHGETEWSQAGRYAGLTDLPLTEAGQAAARALGSRLPHGPFDRVISSPLQRARHTAELLAQGPVETDARLVERDYGDYEGLTTAEIRARVPHWHVWTHGVPHGETLQAMAQRVDSFLQELLPSPQRKVLVVAHAHLIRLMAARWLDLQPQQAALLRVDTLGVAHLGWEREQRVLLGWNA